MVRVLNPVDVAEIGHLVKVQIRMYGMTKKTPGIKSHTDYHNRIHSVVLSFRVGSKYLDIQNPCQHHGPSYPCQYCRHHRCFFFLTSKTQRYQMCYRQTPTTTAIHFKPVTDPSFPFHP